MTAAAFELGAPPKGECMPSEEGAAPMCAEKEVGPDGGIPIGGICW